MRPRYLPSTPLFLNKTHHEVKPPKRGSPKRDPESDLVTEGADSGTGRLYKEMTGRLYRGMTDHLYREMIGVETDHLLIGTPSKFKLSFIIIRIF